MADRYQQMLKGMSRGMFVHAQYVATDGYCWTKELPQGWEHPQDDPGSEEVGPWLRERLPSWMPPELDLEAPLKKRQRPGLHHFFAELAPVEKDITLFAKKWGHLGRRVGSAYARNYAESLPYWQRETETMQRHLALWELIKNKDALRLSSFVRWREKPRQVRIDLAFRDGELNREGARRLADGRQLTCPHDLPGGSGSSLASLPGDVSEILACGHEEHPYREWLFEAWEKGDVIEPARYYLHGEVNRHLEGRVSPLLTTPSKEGRVDLWFIPDTLLASLYVLLALEVSDQVLLPRMCVATDCRRAFVPTSAKQKYCSNACRIRADAQRRRRREQG
jgi:hypothetical protein